MSSEPLSMTVSIDGRYMLTSSAEPPMTHICSIADDKRTIVMLSPVSRTPTVVSAFHPERLDVFLLCHLDGSIAAYQGGPIFQQTPKEHHADQEICQRAQLGHCTRVLRTTSTRDGCGSVTFTGAAFLPGHQCRAVVIGGDYRCRLLEVDRGIVLRTWRVYDRPMAVAVSATRYVRGEDQQLCATKTVIAIALQSSSIRLYSLVGQQLAVYDLLGATTGILDVKWIKGAIPTACSIGQDSSRPTKTKLPVLTRRKSSALGAAAARNNRRREPEDRSDVYANIPRSAAKLPRRRTRESLRSISRKSVIMRPLDFSRIEEGESEASPPPKIHGSRVS